MNQTLGPGSSGLCAGSERCANCHPRIAETLFQAELCRRFACKHEAPCPEQLETSSVSFLLHCGCRMRARGPDVRSLESRAGPRCLHGSSSRNKVQLTLGESLLPGPFPMPNTDRCLCYSSAQEAGDSLPTPGLFDPGQLVQKPRLTAPESYSVPRSEMLLFSILAEK